MPPAALIDKPNRAQRLARHIASDLTLYHEAKVVRGIETDTRRDQDVVLLVHERDDPSDPGLLRHLAQTQASQAFACQNLRPGFDQSVFKVTMVVGGGCHKAVLRLNLNTVKMASYNLYTV